VILITGGAGYIGGCFVWACKDAGMPVVVLDNLSTGWREALPPETPLIVGDVDDRPLVQEICRSYGVTQAVHFAGSVIVEESIRNPAHYYQNNTVSSLALLEALQGAGIKQIVFSSTAAVYGETSNNLVGECAVTRPVSPYGWSKLFVEQMLADIARSTALRFVALRYFNVAGADAHLRTGSRAPSATHLIKACCEVALGKRDAVTIFGTDYPTIDGTGVRDYIHVADLADAHIHALRYLSEGGASLTLNCGYGRGISVRQVIDAFAELLGHPLPLVLAPRRAGDAARVVADTSEILNRLTWRPRYGDIHTIIKSALDWEEILRRSETKET